jgi:hypothetical protein
MCNEIVSTQRVEGNTQAKLKFVRAAARTGREQRREQRRKQRAEQRADTGIRKCRIGEQCREAIGKRSEGRE